MARLEVIWRNPDASKTVRCWAHVKRDQRRSLYVVMESAAAAPGGWTGLPALEIVHGRTGPAPKKTSIIQRFLSGA